MSKTVPTETNNLCGDREPPGDGRNKVRVKLVMLDPQNTKNATSLHVFRAMFDLKGLDPFRVHNFGLFHISVQK